MMKHLNREERDVAIINIISKQKCVAHYSQLWYVELAEDEHEEVERQEVERHVLIRARVKPNKTSKSCRPH